MIKQLLPKCKIKVSLIDMIDDETVGQYDPRSDVILIDRTFKKDFPHTSLLVLLHELMHSTMVSTRTLRINRLIHKFGEFKKGSTSYRAEECIAELAGMVLARQLGMATLSSMAAFTHGITKYYTNDMYIPWKEVVAAVRYYADDDTDFTVALRFVRNWTQYRHHIDIRDGYEPNHNTGNQPF